MATRSFSWIAQQREASIPEVGGAKQGKAAGIPIDVNATPWSALTNPATVEATW
jgi:hypothetical protein